MKTSKIPPLSVGILAGGKSSRMGENKALLKIGDQKMIEKLVSELGVFSGLTISAAKKGDYEYLGTDMVYDEHKDIGPIEGLRTVLSAAEEEYVFICAADMPNITAEFVRTLALFISSDHDCYVVCDEDHLQPLCSIYKKSVLPIIEELIAAGDYRLRKIFDRVNTLYIPLEALNFDKKTVKNVNTKEEYVKLFTPFVFCVSGFSDSGKTGLIVRLINEFKKDNYSVCVLKHDGHDRIEDKPGSDSDRFFAAGADCAAVFSEGESLIRRREKADIREMLARLSGSSVSPDFIIIEGMKNSSYPKIEIVRKDISEESICPPESLICIATDFLSPEKAACPIYGLDDVQGIYLCLKNYFNLK